MAGFVTCQEKTGEAKVTFGNFESAVKCFVKFKSIDSKDSYEVSMHKDLGCNKPFKKEVFKGTDICGLDWGSFQLQKKVAKVFYKPVKTYTYVTIINKTKSISLLFSGDEGEKLNDWKNSLTELFYGGRTYIRQKLIHEGKNVMLQVGKFNISLTEEQNESEPARIKHSWPRDTMYDCSVNGRYMFLSMKSPNFPDSTNLQLECQRTDYQNGKVLTPEDTVARIRNEVVQFVVCYSFTKETIYQCFEDCLYRDYGSDYYDLNKLDDLHKTYGGQIRSDMENVYKKMKDNEENQYAEPHEPQSRKSLTEAEQFAFNAGHVIQQIRARPPIPDTLKLPVCVRTEICLKLYTDTEMGRTRDWTALASQIGIKQGAVNTVKGILANERSNDPAAEIIMRHWQYTYNKYWHRPESEYPDRPKLPCTKEGLITGLKNIGRNDLVRIVSGQVKFSNPSTEGTYQDIC